MEIRFVANRPWDHFPGLFAEKFGSRYPKEEDTGISNIPQVVRDSDQTLTYLPYRRFVGERFALQAGPRVVGLVTKKGAYPGWNTFLPAMEEVLAGLRELRIVRETIRIGVRYINFLPTPDIFEKLTLDFCVGGIPLRNPETGFTTVVKQDSFRQLLQINNSTTIIEPGQPVRMGSIVDLDTTVDLRVPDLFEGALATFERAHAAEKRLFFGLLKPEFVSTLHPSY